MKTKTPEYTKNAIKRYRKKHYYMQVRLPLDYKDRLKAVGLTSSDVGIMIEEELKKREDKA